MSIQSILVKGAREHNLKDIEVTIPRDRLVVITGISGSGKSSLAFDTIYAEGQRRYVESLSAYARQFLGLMEKPDVDYIEGLSPAISIEQRSASKNPRSTVATVTEIYDYLRLLFARIGAPHCYKCGREIQSQTPQQMTDRILELDEGTRIQVLAPVVRGRKGEYREVFDEARREGFVRARVDGETRSLDNAVVLEKNKKHTIEIVVDRLVVRRRTAGRLVDSLETALAKGGGIVVIDVARDGDIVFSECFACTACGISYEEIEPRLFSFNSPFGACPRCAGLGTAVELDERLVVPDPELSVMQGAIAPWGNPNNHHFLGHRLASVARHFGMDLAQSWEAMPSEHQRVLLHGAGRDGIRFEWGSRRGRRRREYVGRFSGAMQDLRRRYGQTKSSNVRAWIEGFMSVSACPGCDGLRLKPQALAVRFRGKNIAEVSALSVKAAVAFFEGVTLGEREAGIASQIFKEIRARLRFLADVGLAYLTLDRRAGTLSGGEAQRIRLATQIGSQLVGVLYILDEPSIGLHHRDNRRLLNTLTSLRDLGNTVLVVEHDRDTIERADHVIDLGPGAGVHGGHVVATGPPQALAAKPRSLTGEYLAGVRQIPVPEERRPNSGEWLVIHGASGNNLKGIDVRIPLGTFTCVAGVSGSGKSTLVNGTLYPALAQRFWGSRDGALPHKRLDGVEHLDKVIAIDQSPIGRTPRSNPATYTGLFTPIRELFAQLPESRMRGYRLGRFSFNVRGGRCEACSGDGIIKIEMHFLPDVYVPCEVCRGRRYARETLEVMYKGKSIADVLEMTVDEALAFFENLPKVRRKLLTLSEVGLGYIRLGQQATTLSGGEAQRVKLSTELSKIGTGRTLYILDEPTTGLHFEDIKMLLGVLGKLADRGNTVVVIEHNLEVLKTADYLIDLGPEGGDEGGEVTAAGTPEEVARTSGSHTGAVLRELLGIKRRSTRAA